MNTFFQLWFLLIFIHFVLRKVITKKLWLFNLKYLIYLSVFKNALVKTIRKHHLSLPSFVNNWWKKIYRKRCIYIHTHREKKGWTSTLVNKDIFSKKFFIYNTIHCLVILAAGWAVAGWPQNIEWKSVSFALEKLENIWHLDLGWPPKIVLHYGDTVKFSWGGCNGVNISTILINS